MSEWLHDSLLPKSNTSRDRPPAAAFAAVRGCAFKKQSRQNSQADIPEEGYAYCFTGDGPLRFGCAQEFWKDRRHSPSSGATLGGVVTRTTDSREQRSFAAQGAKSAGVVGIPAFGGRHDCHGGDRGGQKPFLGKSVLAGAPVESYRGSASKLFFKG